MLYTRAYITMHSLNAEEYIAEILYNIIKAVHRDGPSLLPVTAKHVVHI